MADSKQPTQAERIEALETEVAALKKQVARVIEALAGGDPTLTAAAFAK